MTLPAYCGSQALLDQAEAEAEMSRGPNEPKFGMTGERGFIPKEARAGVSWGTLSSQGSGPGAQREAMAGWNFLEVGKKHRWLMAP